MITQHTQTQLLSNSFKLNKTEINLSNNSSPHAKDYDVNILRILFTVSFMHANTIVIWMNEWMRKSMCCMQLKLKSKSKKSIHWCFLILDFKIYSLYTIITAVCFVVLKLVLVPEIKKVNFTYMIYIHVARLLNYLKILPSFLHCLLEWPLCFL